MTKTSDNYRVVVWGQKGQRVGTKILSKKEYKQQGSARSYAQKESNKPKVHYVELKIGQATIEQFKNGDIDASFKVGEAPPIQEASPAAEDAGAARYAIMIERHETGKLKSTQHYTKFGLTKNQAKKIRARVREQLGTKLTVSTPKRMSPKVGAKIAAAKDAYERKLIVVAEAANDMDSRVAVDKATLEDAMQALLRERQRSVKQAQRALEDTLMLCEGLGVHPSIA